MTEQSTGPSAVGIIANPASARDIRRLVADGSAVTTNDKANLIRRLMVGLARTEVTRVLAMRDLSGLSAAVARARSSAGGQAWPTLEFVDHEITQTAADTRMAVKMMLEAGVGAIVVLGGDGTNRVVAECCRDVPLISISTGTNNAFPRPADPTVAGIVAGLVANGSLPVGVAAQRTKTLAVEHRGQRHIALVDVAVTTDDNVGAGAIWKPETLRELFLCFAEPWAIGLSSIGGHLQPIRREDPHGMRIRFGPGGLRVSAPMAPGVAPELHIAEFEILEMDRQTSISDSTGVIAIDGERGIRFEEGDSVFVTLGMNGPLAVDVNMAMYYAANEGLLTSGSAPESTRKGMT